MKKLLFLAFLLASFVSGGQNFEYQVNFEGIGDNREFTRPYSTPQTILGARGAFEVGLSIDNHRIRGGLSHLLEFGSAPDAQKPLLILYYQFTDENTEFDFGSFPRRGKIDFPLAMLTDTLLVYRPNIEGFFGELRWDWGHQNGFVDWVGRQTELQREQFMAGFSGEIFSGNFFLQNYLLMFHNAHTLYNDPPLHIEDYGGFAIQAGIRTTGDSDLSGSFKAGVLNSIYRERSVTDGYITSNTLFLEGDLRYKRFGVKSVLNSGGGHRFMYGDPYYRADNYWRTDFICYLFEHKNVKGRFNLSTHLVNWEVFDMQQQLSIIYVFGK